MLTGSSCKRVEPFCMPMQGTLDSWRCTGETRPPREWDLPISSPGRKQCRLGSCRFAVPELFRGVAFDPLAVLAHFAFGALPIPSEVLDGDLGGGFGDVEANPWTVTRHRAPQEYVGERLGHLLAEGPDHLGPDERRLDACDRREGREELGIVIAYLENLGGPAAVEL